MNSFLKNLNKVEFAVTYACTGRCKHCSVGAEASHKERLDPRIAADSVRKIASEYGIKTVMTFGGEPLLHTNAVYSVIAAAKEMNIPRRQVITNGYFSKDSGKIREVAQTLYESGVNDLLLSVDAFHQETIPLETVKLFASEAIGAGIPVRLSPAWLVSENDDNAYNRKTREIIGGFDGVKISVGEGNIVFPEGNAIKYLSEYFTDNLPKNPYIEDSRDLRTVSFSPNGDVLHGNVYADDIMEIIKNYVP